MRGPNLEVRHGSWGHGWLTGNHQEKGLRAAGLCRVGFLLVSLLAVLPATAQAAITEFVVPTPNSQPAGITVGPDGALWFTEENGHKIGRITTDGAITEYQIPTVPSAPGEITAGPDGNLWFTEFGANPPKVGRLTPGESSGLEGMGASARQRP